MDKTYHYSIVKNDGRNADYIALELYFQIGEKQDSHKHIPFVYFLKSHVNSTRWTYSLLLLLMTSALGGNIKFKNFSYKK